MATVTKTRKRTTPMNTARMVFKSANQLGAPFLFSQPMMGEKVKARIRARMKGFKILVALRMPNTRRISPPAPSRKLKMGDPWVCLRFMFMIYKPLCYSLELTAQ
jgi:hypothetical protein